MARQSYYYIRVYNDDGTELTTRCEQADGPREACMKAFGVIYDRDSDSAKYRDIGTRAPRTMSDKRSHALKQDGPDWHKIPTTGK